MAGGFARIRIDDPGRVTLYANQQGGFRVRCPECGGNLVPAFQRALTRFRRGGPRRCRCDGCGADLPLEALEFQPPAAFARISLVTMDAGNASLTAEAARWVARALGPWRVVLRRP